MVRLGLSVFVLVLLVLMTTPRTEVAATRLRTVKRVSTVTSTDIDAHTHTHAFWGSSSCTPGSISPSGSSPCTPCPSGQFSNYARTVCLPYKLLSTQSSPNMYFDSKFAANLGDIAHYWQLVPNDNQRWIFDNTININPGTRALAGDACGPNNMNCGLWYTVQSIKNNLCYDSNGPPGYTPHFWTCDPNNNNQIWVLMFAASGSHLQSMTQRLNHANLCLDSNKPQVNGHQGHFWQCMDGNSNQQWVQTDTA